MLLNFMRWLDISSSKWSEHAFTNESSTLERFKGSSFAPVDTAYLRLVKEAKDLRLGRLGS